MPCNLHESRTETDLDSPEGDENARSEGAAKMGEVVSTGEEGTDEEASEPTGGLVRKRVWWAGPPAV